MKHRGRLRVGSHQFAVGPFNAIDYSFKNNLLENRSTANCHPDSDREPTANSKIKQGTIFSFIVFIAVFVSSCSSNYTPRPRGYFKIALPQKQYRLFDQPGYPYTFEYPVYGNIIKDSLFFDQHPENPYWINIDFPRFNGRIYLSYKEIGKNKFDSLVNDAFTLSYKQHTYKASAIQSQEFTTPNGSGGVYFTLKGNAATGNQFFVTDSTKHFLRGALYFSATPNADSLQPVNDFLKKDLWYLINTLKWR